MTDQQSTYLIHPAPITPFTPDVPSREGFPHPFCLFIVVSFNYLRAHRPAAGVWILSSGLSNSRSILRPRAGGGYLDRISFERTGGGRDGRGEGGGG